MQLNARCPKSGDFGYFFVGVVVRLQSANKKRCRKGTLFHCGESVGLFARANSAGQTAIIFAIVHVPKWQSQLDSSA